MITEIMKYMESRKRIIDERITEWLNELNLNFVEVKKFFEGGKRFRSILTLLIGESLELDRKRLLEYAVAIEFVHNSTLIHDDILDEHIRRRIRTSLWKIVGVHDAIILGDMLFSYAGYRLSMISLRALEVISKAIYYVTRGVYLEANPLHSTNSGPKLYLEINRLKTAELFGAATKLGSIDCENEEIIERAYKYGIAVGEAYQLADDLVDVKMLLRGITLSDLKPIKLLIGYITEDKNILKELFSNEDNIRVIKDYLIEYNAEKILIDLIDEKLYTTWEIAETFPKNKFREYLKAIPKLMVKFMLKEINNPFPTISK